MNSSGSVAILCTVRGCGRALERGVRAWRCEAGHSFDVSRRGWVNLLQPQDKRSAEPGDAAEAVEARARCLEGGLAEALRDAVLSASLPALPREGTPAVLDVGCGEGYFLAALAASRALDAHGLDLSTAAIDRAARRLPAACLVVANADRGLPYGSASFDLALSITSRRPVAELRRVVRAGGALVVAVPAEDDLLELRELAQGEGARRERVASVLEEMEGAFELVERSEARRRVALDRARIDDVLRATYRGARLSERRRLEGTERLEVTLAHHVLRFQ